MVLKVLDTSMCGMTPLRCTDDHVRRDYDVMMKAVCKNGEALQCVAKEGRRDRSIVATALHQSGTAIRWASVELRQDRALGVIAVTQSWLAWRELPWHMRQDEELVRLAVGQDPANVLGIHASLLSGTCYLIKGLYGRINTALTTVCRDIKNDGVGSKEARHKTRRRHSLTKDPQPFPGNV